MSKPAFQFNPKVLKRLVHACHAGRLRTMSARKLGNRAAVHSVQLIGNRRKP